MWWEGLRGSWVREGKLVGTWGVGANFARDWGLGFWLGY